MTRTFRIQILSICAALVAAGGWVVIGFGSLLSFLFEENEFPRTLFWTVLIISIPVFYALMYRYFERTER